MGLAEKPRGSALGYRALGFFFRLLGYGFVSAITRFIVFYYFVFARRAVASSMRFYGALMPHLGRVGRWLMAWRQFRSFSTVFLDRLLIVSGQAHRFRFEHDGLDRIARLRGRPLILLMAHLGNWEVATHVLRGFDVPITVVLSKRQGERVETRQKEELERRGVKLVYLREERDFGVLETLGALRNGAAVALSGDRLFDRAQRAVEVDFLGHRCPAPVGPYVLALISGADLVPIFGMREGHLAYRFMAFEPIRVEARDRADREAALARAAQSYFDLLEKMVRRYPEQWYNFFDYWDTNDGNANRRR